MTSTSVVRADSSAPACPFHACPVEASAAEALVERLAEEMRRRWQAGERPLAEEFLVRHPEFWDQPEAATELIYEEICLRQEHGEVIAAEDILRRFPQWREQLQVVLHCHQLMEADAAPPLFPAVGETLGDFHILAELGRGAVGRVFLATQHLLADRPVVLKLVPASGQEHLSLARLQHTHIVPLYFVEDDPSRNLRILCMPYFGGNSLARILEAVHDQPPGQRTGQHLLQALKHVQAAVPVSLPVKGPACQFFAQATYPQAICWIGACLADALHYSHERGLVHLDLKPSNVLCAADGQPMLLDLHLARGPLRAGEPAPEWLGGTPGYMAVEQEAALAAVREHRPIPVGVDGRADIYSLGVLLYEALGGSVPLPAGMPTRELRRRNPLVTVGLADILEKCLAPDPAQRYRHAAALAADLRRHLANMPLRGVVNRSLAERWRKWRRRRPYAQALLGLILTVLVASTLGLAHTTQDHYKARAALREAQDHLAKREYGEAHSAAQRGLALVESIPFQKDLAGNLRDQMHLADRAQAAHELHRFLEHLRTVYGAEGLAVRELQIMEAHCRTFWERRDEITQRLGSQPSAELEQQTQTDLLDLAILWTDLRVRLATESEMNAARQEALEVLAQAEELFGPSRVLCHERQVHAAALRLRDLADAAARQGAGLPPHTAWEHYALGRALLQEGNRSLAASYFERAVDLHPQDFWPNFYQGKCAFQDGRYEDAILAFTACVALAPQNAWCSYNRGLAYMELGRADRALRDYTRALELEPGLALAALSRAMLHYRAQRYHEALSDLRRALDHGADPATVHYDEALVQLAQGDRSAALDSLRAALQHNPEHREACFLRERLLRSP
jgi:serine/threonine protein kinase/tetratricopeptide (TPR) repeat protein